MIHQLRSEGIRRWVNGVLFEHQVSNLIIRQWRLGPELASHPTVVGSRR